MVLSTPPNISVDSSATTKLSTEPPIMMYDVIIILYGITSCGRREEWKGGVLKFSCSVRVRFPYRIFSPLTIGSLRSNFDCWLAQSFHLSFSRQIQNTPLHILVINLYVRCTSIFVLCFLGSCTEMCFWHIFFSMVCVFLGRELRGHARHCCTTTTAVADTIFRFMKGPTRYGTEDTAGGGFPKSNEGVRHYYAQCLEPLTLLFGQSAQRRQLPPSIRTPPPPSPTPQ